NPIWGCYTPKLELKELPEQLEYAFLQECNQLPEKCHFMVKEGIILGYKVLGSGIEVDKSKIKEFNIKIRDKKGAENLSVDHLSLLKNLDLGRLTRAEIRYLFPEERIMEISYKNYEACRPSGGHHGIATITQNVLKAGFYWLHVFRDARKLIQVCDACQRAGNISSNDEAS
nr:hypothetical protein [Tanacetum cinerariifolium]